MKPAPPVTKTRKGTLPSDTPNLKRSCQNYNDAAGRRENIHVRRQFSTTTQQSFVSFSPGFNRVISIWLISLTVLKVYLPASERETVETATTYLTDHTLLLKYAVVVEFAYVFPSLRPLLVQ